MESTGTIVRSYIYHDERFYLLQLIVEDVSLDLNLDCLVLTGITDSQFAPVLL